MTTITTDVDPDKLMAFVFRAVEEAGAALNSALVVMGDRLGYYRSLAQHGAARLRSWPSEPRPTSTTPANGSMLRPQAHS